MYPLAGYEVGSVFAERFQILSLLGVGGYGAVFRALDLAHESREVALKLVSPSADCERGGAHIELLLQHEVVHPNILRILEEGESADGITFLVMEHLAGCSLRDCLDAAPNGLPVDEAVAILGAIAAGLAEAHRRGIVHCDLKPSNVLLGNDGRVVVADFGVARRVDEVTEGSELVGTPHYMAPEQLRGASVTPATDVFSFGALAYELITGHSAFDGDDLSQLIIRHRRPLPLARCDIPVALPAWLRRLLIDCCASDPGARPKDGATLSHALTTRSYAAPLHRRRWRWLTRLWVRGG